MGKKLKKQDQKGAERIGHAERDGTAFPYPSRLARPKVLPGKGRDGKRNALEGQQGKLVYLAKTGPAGHERGAKAVYVAHHEDIRESRDRHLDAARQPLPQHAGKAAAVYRQLPQAPTAALVRPEQHDEDHEHCKELRGNGCPGSPSYAHPAADDEDKIKDDVHQGRDDEEIEDEFYENMEYFLRRRIATANQIAELEEELGELRQSNSRQAKTIDRYVKAYGRELLNG